MKSTDNNFVNYLSAEAASLAVAEEEAGLYVVFDALLWAFVFAMAELVVAGEVLDRNRKVRMRSRWNSVCELANQ